VPRAVTLALLGEHMVRYTEEDVLPRLDRRIAELRATRRAERDATGAAGPPGARPAGLGGAILASAQGDIAGAGRAAAAPVR
jgi:hypothetical protein